MVCLRFGLICCWAIDFLCLGGFAVVGFPCRFSLLWGWYNIHFSGSSGCLGGYLIWWVGLDDLGLGGFWRFCVLLCVLRFWLIDFGASLGFWVFGSGFVV